MKDEIVAVILSGGKNSRMNYNTKAFLEIDGRKFIERVLENLNGFKEIIISCNDLELYKEFANNCRLVSDIKKNIGPIGGLYSIFKNSSIDKIFVVASDMPFVDYRIINSMCEIDFKTDALVGCVNGKIEPLFAIYKRSILEKIESAINDKNYKMMSLLKESNTSYFYINDEKSLRNINTVEQYKKILTDKKIINAIIKPTIINIVASTSNSGKTTLIEGIIKGLKKKNYTVSTIKHDVHGFDIDKKGKDTYKHRMAGADNVSISSKNRFALIREVNEELTLEEVIENMPSTDFIIVEGYKKSSFRKIEVFRNGISREIITPEEKLIAIATDDKELNSYGKIVDINNYDAIIALIEKEREECIH